jgi:hypothetical protein
MNCQAIQNQLLILPDPRRPGADVRAHLQGCAACRQWHQRLIQLERHMPLLPVPSSTARAGVMRRFLAGGTVRRPKPPAPWPSVPPSYRMSLQVSRSSNYVAAGVAAALVLAVLGGWVWLSLGPGPAPAKRPPPPDPFLASLFKRDLRLAVARTPQDRLEALLELAEDLHGQARAGVQAAGVEDLENLAQLFDQVVRQGMVPVAQKLPPAERRRLLDAIAGRLARTSREADQLAQNAPAAPADALRQIAAAARFGDGQLRNLLHGPTS